MANDIAIEATDVGKRYEISGDQAGYLLLTERITELVNEGFQFGHGDRPAVDDDNADTPDAPTTTTG